MNEYKLDAVIVTGIKNTLALSGAAFPDEVWYEMVHGLDPSVLVLAPGGKSSAFSSRPFDDLEGFAVEHLPYELLPETTWASAARELRDRGFDRGRIGVDMGHTAAAFVAVLQQELPDVEFVDAETVMMRLRAVKTPGEIELTRKVIAIGEDAFDAVRDVFKVDTPIGDCIRALAHAVMDRGGLPHILHPFELNCSEWRVPDEAVNGLNRNPARMEAGVTTRLDICINHRGYYSDFKLPICVGEPSAHALAVTKEHVEREQLMEELVRPGKTKREIHDALMKEFKHLDEYDWWLHGTGIDYHEEPRIGSRYPSSPGIRPDIVFEEGNILALEPSWLVEEQIILEADGPKRMNRLETRAITVL